MLQAQEGHVQRPRGTEQLGEFMDLKRSPSGLSEPFEWSQRTWRGGIWA